MNDKEQTTMLIDAYMNLLRIEKAEDKQKEIANQLCATRAKLQALGVVVDDLVIQ